MRPENTVERLLCEFVDHSIVSVLATVLQRNTVAEATSCYFAAHLYRKTRHQLHLNYTLIFSANLVSHIAAKQLLRALSLDLPTHSALQLSSLHPSWP